MLKKIHKFLYYYLSIFLLTWSVNAQYIFEESNLPGKISLYHVAEVADVGSSKITIYDVLSNVKSYRHLRSENENLGFSTHYFWIKFELENRTTNHLEYYLEAARPTIDLADLYQIDSNSKITRFRSGDNMSFEDRSYKDRKCSFKIILKPGEKLQYYLHLQSGGDTINLPLLLRDTKSLMEISSLEQFFFGIFYGILLIAGIIYLFFYFALHERVFAFYSLYIFAIGLMQFSIDGYFYQFITPNGGYFSLRSVLIFAAFATFFLGRYSQLFLHLKTHDPIMSKFLNVWYVLLLMMLMAVLFIPAALPYCFPVANILGMLILLTIFVSVIRLGYLKVPVDNFFKIGITFLILGFVIFILNNFGQMSPSFVWQNSSKFGTGIEVIFLSLSMANLIRKIKTEREDYNNMALLKSEEMNDMKSYFLSNISHELRTPLNAIMNISNDMSKNADDEKVRQNAQVIKYSSHSLLSSINDILDFSKIEKGEIVLESVNFEPLKVLEHIKNNAAVRAKDQGLDFIYSRSAYIPEMLNGDVIRLGQIVNNVFSNAIKFTPSGFVKFGIESESRPENKARLTLTISDSGVGIPKTKMDSIFDSFTQDNFNNKRKFGGLGLGLYIVKSLVDMKGGSIVMESIPNVGTNCKIVIEYDVVTQSIHSETLIDAFDLHGKKILVVEDNGINQIVIKMIASKWKNVTVIYVNNGLEGVEAVKEQNFDLILMDLQMPIMDGYEAATAIRNGEAGESNKNIPIIAVTADVMESTKQKIKDLGMNDYLSKPLRNETLYEAVKKLI